MSSNRHSPATVIVPPTEALKAAQRDLAFVKNGLPKALHVATNRTLKSARTIAADELADTITAKRGNILGRIRTLVRASAAFPEGVLRILGRRIGMVNFKHRERRGKRKGRKYGTSGEGQGIWAQAYKSGREERFPHAFKATGKSGNVHIFERIKKGGKIGTRAGRFPIFSRKGLSLLSVFKEVPGLEDRVKKKIMDVFGENILSQVDRLLKRKKQDRPPL